MANEGITDDIRAAFIVYLLSHTRPMAEVLAARPKDIAHAFHNNFTGMTAERVTLDELVAARTALVETIVGEMPDQHRAFLISFEAGQPDWDLLGLPKADRLPAILWRQKNLDLIGDSKRAALVAALEKVLGKALTPTQLLSLPERSGRSRKRPSKRK